MIIYRILRNITHELKQAMRRFVEAHIVQDDPCTSELEPEELEAIISKKLYRTRIIFSVNTSPPNTTFIK